MSETPQEIVDRVFRENRRYTGDGLPGEPQNAPLPVGDPASGPHNPKKADMRAALLAPLLAGDVAVQAADRAEEARDDAIDAADRAEVAASGVESPVSYAPQPLTPEQRQQARQNLRIARFDTIPDLLADETLGYAPGAGKVEVVQGGIIEAQGFRYEVVASDAPEFDEETAGGVRLVLAQYDEALREQSRSLIHAVGYDEQTLVSSEQEQARINIGASYGRIAALLTPYRKITGGDHTRHKGFPVVGILPNGRIVVCYRDSTKHPIAESSMEAIYSDDGGLTWSSPTTVASNAGHDFANYAAGVTQSGVMIVATEDITVSTNGASGNYTRFYASTDGVTWSERTGAAIGPQGIRIVPYGKLILRDDGSAYFRCYLGGSSDPASVGDQGVLSSSNDFVSQTFTKVWDGTGSLNLTEPYTVDIGGGYHFSFGRRESPSDDTPYYMLSSDEGVTWGTPSTIGTLKVGRNPPSLWYDEDQEILYAIWPSRGEDRISDGTDWTVFPWYFATISRAELLGANKRWRAQIPFPLFSPNQDNNSSSVGGGGDSGTGHVFEAHGMKFMVYYAGSGGEGRGASLYIANLSVLMGL